MKLRLAALLLPWLLALSVNGEPLLHDGAPPSDTEARYDSFLTRMDALIEAPYAEQSVGIRSAYATAFSAYMTPDHDGEELTDRDLYFLLMSSEAALSIINSEEIADHAQRVFGILQSRGEPDLASVSSYYRAMIYAGRFHDALKVEPSVRGTPLAGSTSNPGEIARTPRAIHVRLPGTGQYEVREGPVIQDGVYVIGHMFCPWTRRALADLSKNEETRAYIERNAVFLAPKSTILQRTDASPIRNVDFSVVLDQSQWPEVTRWALPTFVFIEDGDVVHQINGWPDADRMEEFQKAMRSQGSRRSDVRG